MSSADSEGRKVLVAYIYQRPGTPSATRVLLREYIERFAECENFVLDSVFVGVEGHTQRFTVRDLVQHVDVLTLNDVHQRQANRR